MSKTVTKAETLAAARKSLEGALASAWKAYEEATASARKAYEEALKAECGGDSGRPEPLDGCCDGCGAAGVVSETDIGGGVARWCKACAEGAK